MFRNLGCPPRQTSPQNQQVFFKNNWSEVTVDSLPQEITWLSGAPGAGKGTNSEFISEICGYKAPTIVVSSLLELPEFKRIKDAGGIVDDAAVFKVLSAELAKPQYKRGVVVDGFPRTEQQAAWLSNLYQKISSNGNATKFNFVMLYVDEATSVSRQLFRGEDIRRQNNVRRNSGDFLLEERTTDVCGMAAKVRYQGFIEKYQAISQTLAANDLPFYVVDASASVESVRQNLASYLTPNSAQSSQMDLPVQHPLQKRAVRTQQTEFATLQHPFLSAFYASETPSATAQFNFA